MALVHDMGTHSAGRGFTVRTSDTESLMLTGQRAQHLSAFLNLKTVLTEKTQFLMIFRDGGCIDYQTRLLLFADKRNVVDILLIVNEHTLALQLTSECAWSLVIAGYNKPFLDKVAGDGAHADATSSYEIDRFDILCIHLLMSLFIDLLT